MKHYSRRRRYDLRKQQTESSATVGFFELFHYATTWDCILISIGIFTSFLRALTFPIAILVYGELIAMFIDRNVGIGSSSKVYILPAFGGGKLLENATHDENMLELKNDSIAFGIVISLDAVLMFVSGILSVDIFNYVALMITARLRKYFFEATIRQDIAWHDTVKNQNFPALITDNIEKIRNGIAENITHFLMLIFDILISVTIAICYGWKLALTIFGYIPIAVIINVLVIKFQTKLSAEEQNAYANASTVVEESIGAIRTVVAFGGEKQEAKRFCERLVPGRIAGIRRGMWSGLNDSFLKAMLFLCSAASFFYGSRLIIDDRPKQPENREYTPAILMIVMTGIIVSADHISRLAPFIEGFSTARGSAEAIYSVINLKSKIDPLSTQGKSLNAPLTGNIQFEDVFFRYPAREDATVLSRLSFNIKEGQTVALVGYSGCGKSTCIQLIQRFYDPDFGRIMIDNIDIRKYNIGWLRKNIAVVGQEPVLFCGTIGENIRHGKPNARQKEVEEAAKAAGAHDFIISLPQGYNSVISEKGVQLSGGQRQRIAIARALIQNPKILLLDEATSALDYHSEKVVQSALDKASIGRTTIVVSHRLSSIKMANHIIFLDAGNIIEQGSHEELVKLGGKYAQMINVHESNSKDLEDEDDVKGDDVYGKGGMEEKEEALSTSFYGQTASKDESCYSNTLCSKESFENVKPKNEYSSFGHTNACNEVKIPSFTTTFYRVLRMAKREWIYLGIGAICAGIYGCTQPAFAVVCGEFFGTLAVPTDAEILKGTSRVALLSTIIGIVSGVAGYTQTFLFNLSGIALTRRIRSTTFRSILRQEIGWFDVKENSVGALSARLAGDAANVQSAVGFPLSNLLQAFTNFFCSFSIAFSFSWKLSLVSLITAPVMVASIIFEARFAAASAIREKELLEDTSRLATESISQIRTVAALNRESDVIDQYDKDLALYVKQIRRRLRYRGLINSLGMSTMFVGYAITIIYGGIMVTKNQIHFADVMKIANSLLYGLFLLAQSLAFMPAFIAAIGSAGRLYQIIDREPLIQCPEIRRITHHKTKSASTINTVNGVSFQNVHFTYPTRPKKRILRNFDLEVLEGQTVAFVGSSGSGKSTCIQLLLRFYDPQKGKIFIDQDNIHRNLSLPALRRRLGIVSQEPSLFEMTIAENIAYGDTSRIVPLAEIIEAAKMANAHDFIVALPNGYETKMGARGTQLSGGQKQRIAIARALVRNPKILLLDEATSALDLQSERVVQLALNEACTGRTCIVIAHRLSTVQNADLICVLHSGQIVERGNHAELLAINGIYAKLYRNQPITN